MYLYLLFDAQATKYHKYFGTSITGPRSLDLASTNLETFAVTGSRQPKHTKPEKIMFSSWNIHTGIFTL